MATLQARKSRGQKYWYIVESRRVNGKPRPITLAYLGKPNSLLKRLQQPFDSIKLKSYSHGAVAALLQVSRELNICSILNKYISSSRKYTAKKPIRNKLTAGATLLLAAIGRACEPSSKSKWYDWAKTTSLSYLLKCSLSKLDSQHFWDLMDTIPSDAIEKIEAEIIKKAFEKYNISSDTLFYDTTNFFTYIHTTNERCTIAKRGRNKQKRKDLRQVGLALVVTRQEMIPLLHLTYEGNKHDAKVFPKIIKKIKTRLEKLGLDANQHVMVFDRGNNSKKNLALLKKEGFHYVGALTPYQHKKIVYDAISQLTNSKEQRVYRDKRTIWGEKRTVVVFISEGLKAKQLNWIYRALGKIEESLCQLQLSLSKRRKKKIAIEAKIKKTIEGYEGFILYKLNELTKDEYQLAFSINQAYLEKIENQLGFRIIMTDKHDWTNEKIIQAYHGQSHIERSFRHLKNPRCLAVRPQFHWTNQKIKVHFFTCVLAYLLTSILWTQVKKQTNYAGDLAPFIKQLNNIRLGTILEDTKTQGKMKANYQLEAITKEEQEIMKVLNIQNFHVDRPKINGVVVYN